MKEEPIIYGCEALVRGLNNESAFSIISKVNDDNRYFFDQQCRVKAIALASELKMDSILSTEGSPHNFPKAQPCLNRF